MLTGGHIAASYLIAEAGRRAGINMESIQIIGIIVVGNLPDVDFVTGFFNGKTGEMHHQNITHTPVGILIMWTGIVLIGKLQIQYAFILLCALMLHLFMDDLGIILSKFKLFNSTPHSQINWLYPFTPYPKRSLIKENKKALKYYFINGWPIAVLEIFLIIVALIVYLKN